MIDRTNQPPIRSMGELNMIVPEHILLKNGIPLNVIRSGSEDVVRLDILIGAGRWNQSQNLQALFANRMLREGTVRLSGEKIAEQLDYYGAWLDLSTSFEYSYITLYSLNKYFQQTLSIVASMLMEPIYPEDRLQTVVNANLQQWIVNSVKVESIAQQAFVQAIFGLEHPNGKVTTKQSYTNLTRQCLVDFYKEKYHSGNCWIYLSGKVTSSILSQVQDVLGSESWGEVKLLVPRIKKRIESASEKSICVKVDNTMQSCVKMGCTTVNANHPDSNEMKVLMTVFGGYFGSRLMQNIREDKGYTYGISSGISTTPDTGVMIVNTETANEHVEALIREVYHEMDVLRTDLIPANELDMVRNYMIGDACRSYEGPFAQSDAWIYLQTNNLSPDYFQDSIDAIRYVKATKLRKLAQKYFKNDKMFEVVAGK